MKSPITALFKIIAAIVAILVITFLVVISIITVQDYYADFQKERELVAQKEADQCRSDISCWADKESVMATLLCMKNIELFAKYDYRWSDSRSRIVLSRHTWANQEEGLVRYFGDSLQLQNGFGAWQNYIYSCDFDPTEQKVVDIGAEPGRL
ncbi:hypothetical protein [Neptunomonas antarctica]|uniref:Uncharacterized protein n=1 Tax=Neptunomonas antarctica TaxID=619304 RepID=A0A1N7MPX8_9GAMM|nr:hypothetical protein [Neptunomonas antarctica]SIS88167.1 hypothetical protein SAMN05421760_106256 [Neptunomonas antarctica]